MLKWFSFAGFIIWAVSVITVRIAMSRGVIAEPVTLRLPDGTPIRGTLFRPRSPNAKLRMAVIAHGTALAHQSCIPGLAIPLARNGYLALAIDLRGHGRSGGSLPKKELDASLPALVATREDHPELEAAIQFLLQHPLVVAKDSPVAKPPTIALVGHSRGGWAAANVGYLRNDVASVVSIGAAPAMCDVSRPHNLLILTGKEESLFPVKKCIEAIFRATGGAVYAPNLPFGQFEAGSARRLLIVSGANHLTELADPSVTRRVVQWFGSSLSIDAGEVPGKWLLITIAGVLAASVGGLIACIWPVTYCASIFLSSRLDSARDGSGWRLGIVYLLIVAAVPLAASYTGKAEVGPVYFALPSVLLAGLVALVAFVVALPKTGAIHHLAPAFQPGLWVRAIFLSGVSLALVYLALGIPWGMSWTYLLPTARRLWLLMVLWGLLFPATLGLAWGVQKLTGEGANSRWARGARAGAWLILALVIWAGQRFFANGKHPLFLIPVGFWVASFVLVAPLWLIPSRRGLCLTRAITHAGLAAWLLACHLPFVHGE